MIQFLAGLDVDWELFSNRGQYMGETLGTECLTQWALLLLDIVH